MAAAEVQAQAQSEPATVAAAPAPQDAPQATPTPSAPAAAEAQPAQPAPPPVEQPHAEPAPSPAPGDHAAPATPAGDAHGGASAHGPPAQGEHAAPGSAGHGATSEHGGDEAHGGGITDVIYRLINFAILAGGLYYFLHKPIGDYFATRGQQIRGGLITARDTSERATAQLAELDRRLQALPAEIEAVRAKGVQEIKAEEARIQAQAEAERRRLIDDVQRDIDVRVRVARKRLAEDAADFAVKAAADRVRATITDADQARLIDRYATQVKDIHG